MFYDRKDAGEKLAKALGHYQGSDPTVFAIHLGGIPIGNEVAQHIKAKFSLIVTQKLPFPNSPGSGFGAIAEDNSIFLLPGAAYNLSSELINAIVLDQKKEIERRIKVLRGNRPLPDIKGKTVILVSDGIATGPSVYAAIHLCRKRQPERIIIGSPVSCPEVARSLDQMAEVHEAVILAQPKFFRAVSQVYENWPEVTELEVLEIMDQWQRQRA